MTIYYFIETLLKYLEIHFILKTNDLISMTYYLLIQNHFKQAIDVFNIIKLKIENTNNHESINAADSFLFDYLQCYMALVTSFDDYNNDYNKLINTIKLFQYISDKYENIPLISTKQTSFDDVSNVLFDLKQQLTVMIQVTQMIILKF